ncbi:hypothetical protein AB0M39_24325 [Streptomyces sp. NPDC051907]|uniref:hypothetical protein n=1 Tax=Streptomyces sp. NPDC051907 TaxID=3155284 RepID=UPI00342FFAD7
MSTIRSRRAPRTGRGRLGALDGVYRLALADVAARLRAAPRPAGLAPRWERIGGWTLVALGGGAAAAEGRPR